ncbi:MAG: hypothetical protein WC635_05415 [Bacteriovorax sp.]|jgi:hypothetical protein
MKAVDALPVAKVIAANLICAKKKESVLFKTVLVSHLQTRIVKRVNVAKRPECAMLVPLIAFLFQITIAKNP